MIKPNWDYFQVILVKNKVPQNQKYYYVKHIEEYLKFLQNSELQVSEDNNNTAMTCIKAENVSSFLQEIDRKLGLSKRI